MSVERIDGARCYVLHRRAYRESSQIVELFTADHGRIAAVARASRSPRSPFRGLTEPFLELSAGWVRRGELATLTGLEPTQLPSPRLARKPLWCGLYINELMLRLVAKDDPEPDLFQAYSALISALPDTDHLEQWLRSFEWCLLRVLGVAPALDVCSRSQDTVAADRYYALDSDTGMIEVDARVKGAVRGNWLIALTQHQALPADQSAAGRQLLRRLIEAQLDGKPLKTPQMFGRRT
ncbi:MAG: DNA repair protein RecO [Pseudomonadota bacterium]